MITTLGKILKISILAVCLAGCSQGTQPIEVTEASPGLGIPLGFLDVSHNKLILWIEAAAFELTRVGE
ncbi:hypothetical protein ACFTAO_14765 [Paenibacillus rhizoplanae]|uniref:Uncharacterized protein n=1 Tax=Paenibacillus rhizoplanae TaxID=1917181 RepID=A0ABW5FDW8_9BACL